MNKIKRTNRQTKNEHYVPRCYLKRWGNEKNQIFVYDKLRGKTWSTNIANVACERFFYDIDYKKLNKESLLFLQECSINPEEDEQFIEHLFSKQIETKYADLLSKLTDREDITPWYEKNCYFLSKIEKVELSFCLTYQFLRTRATRSAIRDSSNVLTQWLDKMGIDEKIKEKYVLKPGEENIVHANMLLNPEHVIEMAEIFHNLTWILVVNRTDLSLFTSDTPIGTCAHISSPYMSMSGIASKGIEVALPLSPKHILVMYDTDYHTRWRGYDRHYCSVTNELAIKRYNDMITYNSGQFVFSADGIFDSIEMFVKEYPNLIKESKVQLVNGKDTYIPKEVMISK